MEHLKCKHCKIDSVGEIHFSFSKGKIVKLEYSLDVDLECAFGEKEKRWKNQPFKFKGKIGVRTNLNKFE